MSCQGCERLAGQVISTEAGVSRDYGRTWSRENIRRGKSENAEGGREKRTQEKKSLFFREARKGDSCVKLEDVWGHHLMILNVSILIKKAKRLK